MDRGIETIVITSTSSALSGAIACLETESVLALDCEGMDLGREGEISIIQLSTRDKCFLFDVIDLTPSCELVLLLKPILENSDIMKIIHDSKMDGDALLHKLDIRLINVHDTQAWDLVLKGQARNLNQTLISYDCAENLERSSDVYKINKRFWATRPMTQHMIDWSSGDVTNLFALFYRQKELASPEEEIVALEKSEAQAAFLREKVCQVTTINPKHMGRCIGPGGSNIRSKMSKVPGSFFQTRGPRNAGIVAVYAPDDSSLSLAIALLRPYTRK